MMDGGDFIRWEGKKHVFMISLTIKLFMHTHTYTHTLKGKQTVAFFFFYVFQVCDTLWTECFVATLSFKNPKTCTVWTIFDHTPDYISHAASQSRYEYTTEAV